jgi:hypothetical protein
MPFAAILHGQVRTGDYAGIAQLIDKLGFGEAAKRFSEAGKLPGLGRVLAKAAFSPELGDQRRQALTTGLLQQAGRSGTDALSVAAILHESGTSPESREVKGGFLVEIDKALGDPTTDARDHTDFVNAALKVIGGDPMLLSQYLSKMYGPLARIVASKGKRLLDDDLSSDVPSQGTESDGTENVQSGKQDKLTALLEVTKIDVSTPGVEMSVEMVDYLTDPNGPLATYRIAGSKGKGLPGEGTESDEPGNQDKPTAVFVAAKTEAPTQVPAKAPTQVPTPGIGLPQDAKDGVEAAQDLLSPDNPSFYDNQLFNHNPTYSPDRAKAQAFLATLRGYEAKGDKANIAKLLQTLGPDQAAKFVSDAGKLQDPQANQVLVKALLTPGVKLGDPAQPGSLANSLLEQAKQSGSDALSIAGIFSQLGTSPQAAALKKAFVDEITLALGNPANSASDRTDFAKAALTVINSDPTLLSTFIDPPSFYGSALAPYGAFGSDGANVPQFDRDLLLGFGNPVSGSKFNNGVQSDFYNYLAGTLGNSETAAETPAQRLQNLMSVLGPERTYAILGHILPKQVQAVQSSLNTLVANGEFTAQDANALALAQGNLATSDQFDLGGMATVANFINSLPNTPAGAAVKAGYVQGSISAVQQLAQEIASGQYSGQVLDQLKATLTFLGGNAMQLAAKLPDPLKLQFFSQLRSLASGLAGTPTADVINAFAANILGLLGDKAQVAAILRGMGGVGANGAIDPNSDLARFLQSALRGQAQFGVGPVSNLAAGSPQGVTSLLTAIQASGDKELMAGTLDTVMHWAARNPKETAAIASQDTGPGATGFRDALTNLLGTSFDQFVALYPTNPNAKGVQGMQPDTMADLQVLSAIEVGPPFDHNIAGNFAAMLGFHAVQYAGYAVTADATRFPGVHGLLSDAEDPRGAAARIFGQLLSSFGSGVLNSQNRFFDQAHDPVDMASGHDNQINNWRIDADIARGAGTFLLLGSAWTTDRGWAKRTILGAPKVDLEKALSMLGRLGLWGGSVGTLIIDSALYGDPDDQFQKRDEAERQRVADNEKELDAINAKATDGLRDFYNGFYGEISQIRGPDGKLSDKVLDHLEIGSAEPGTSINQVGLGDFYRDYNPIEYYHDQTGEDPPVVS